MIRKARAPERERDNDTVRKPGQRWTVEKWLTHWVEAGPGADAPGCADRRQDVTHDSTRPRDASSSRGN